MSAFWRIELFGGLCARRGDHCENRFTYRKAGELLAYLALNLGEEVNRDELLSILWPYEEDVDVLRVRLRQVIKSLRRQIEPSDIEQGAILITNRESIYLNRAFAECDVLDFEIEVALAKHCPPDKVEKHLEKAAALYRGELLQDQQPEWITSKQVEIQERFVEVADELSELQWAKGAWNDSISVQKKAAKIECYEEARYERLLRALKETNRLPEAVQVYEEFRTRLLRDLGEPPSTELEALAIEIKDLMKKGTSAPIKDQAIKEKPPARRFPVPPTRLFGRESELENLKALLADGTKRIVTLVGPGGAGKTRLALELAESLFYVRAGEIWFIQLAELNDPREIANATLAALRISKEASGEAIDYIVDELSQCDAPILIFDNFEHLVEGGAMFVRDLVTRLPNVVCLITSRHQLRLEGEQELLISLLPIPPEGETALEELLQNASLQLFVDRAKLARADFQLSQRNLDAVVGICRRLEGIPLAIELCAALSLNVTPAQMLQGLEKRFALLVSRRRDIVLRHRTLHAAIEYSFQMLPEKLARIFAQTSIFQGWSAEAFGEVLRIADAASALQELQTRSLIVIGAITEDVARYKMLETLREFAWEKLSEGEQEELALKHLAYFHQFVARETEAGNFDRIGQEWNNIMAAMRWAVAAENPQVAFELCNDLYPYMSRRRDAEEVWNMFEKVFSRLDADNVELETRCRAAFYQTRICLNELSGEKLLLSSRRFIDLAKKLGDAYYLPLAKTYSGIATKDVRQIEDALSMVSSQNDPGLQALILINLAVAHREFGLGTNEELYQEALSMAIQSGEKRQIATVLYDLAAVFDENGRRTERLQALQDSLSVSDESGDQLNRLRCLSEIAFEYLMLGQLDRAKQTLTVALRESLVFQKRMNAAHAVEICGCLIAAGGDCGEAALLFGSADSLINLVGRSLRSARDYSEPYRLACETTLGPAYQLRWQDGYKLTFRQAIEAALAALEQVVSIEQIAS